MGIFRQRPSTSISTVYYGYRAWGPNWIYNSSWTPGSATGFVSVVDSAGNRFNPNKLLLDPYALEISSDPIGPSLPNADPTVFTSELNRDYDTQQIAPKGIVVTPAANAFGTKPTRAQKDDVIYEMNVRGMTANDSSIPQAERGTYAGAAQKATYLQSLGVTGVELQPVQEVQNDQDDIYAATHGGVAPPIGDTSWNSGQYYKDNYWGYMTLAYFAPTGAMRRTRPRAARPPSSRRWSRRSTMSVSRSISWHAGARQQHLLRIGGQ
jgi:glycogen operon protein